MGVRRAAKLREIFRGDAPQRAIDAASPAQRPARKSEDWPWAVRVRAGMVTVDLIGVVCADSTIKSGYGGPYKGPGEMGASHYGDRVKLDICWQNRLNSGILAFLDPG
jgi:hypothetical protein